MQRTLFIPVLMLSVMLVWSLCYGSENVLDYKGKKVVWVDSYHQGYPWSDGIARGIRNVFKGRGIQLSIVRLNTKLNDSSEFGRIAGEKAKEEIEKINPDLVIATDDNAQKYLVCPHLKNTLIPIVFAGVNWDASEYGYPCRNVTGMVEIDLVEELIANMQRNANGSRVGFLSVDVETARKVGRIINKRFFNNSMSSYLVSTFTEFKKQFLRAQSHVDMLIIYNYEGIRGWDPIAAENFLSKNTRIPTGALLQFVAKYAVYTLGKYSEEQGEYAARTALKILGGTSPDNIPLVKNVKSELTVNLKMAKSAGIIFPLSTLKIGNVIGKDAYLQPQLHEEDYSPENFGKKIVWVDSYHKGYEWSDGIERGIREIFTEELDITLKIIRMDTKRNSSLEFGQRAAKRALQEIRSFSPDGIIASDDNAQKFLIVPFMVGSQTPVVFCGVNWDASMYGYPAANVSGMVEIEFIEDLVRIMRNYAGGGKVGFLSGDVPTERKVADYYNEKLFSGNIRPYYVKTQESFQQAFLRAQQEVDILILSNYTGISGWESEKMEDFISNNIRVPTGSFHDFMARYVIFTMAKSPEEQGNYAARTMLSILAGESPASLPITVNLQKETTVNVKMADAAGIVLPIHTLKEFDTVIGQEALLEVDRAKHQPGD